MNFGDQSQKATCPYNVNHMFDKEKLIFHLNRCKDKAKVGHLFTYCQYNRIHIIHKDDIQTHELFCPDKDDIKRLTSQLKETLRRAQVERERSREKAKKQREDPELKAELKKQNDHPDDYLHLEECPICQRTINSLDQLKKVVPASTLAKIKTVEKMLKMNKNLIEAEEKLKNN